MLQLCDRLAALESPATFVKLTPLQPKIAASRGLDPIAARRGNADALSAAALHAALHPFHHRDFGNLYARSDWPASPRRASRSRLAACCFRRSVLLGICDLIQTRHAILRNYPIAAHIRFILEHIRPELRQYFFEAEKDGTPFPRDKRALVYQRAKQQLDTRPFGTHYDVYRDHYEWLHHSIQPKRAGAGALPHHDRRGRMHAALLGIRVQHLGHELWLVVGQRHSRAEQGRQARRLCP